MAPLSLFSERCIERRVNAGAYAFCSALLLTVKECIKCDLHPLAVHRAFGCGLDIAVCRDGFAPISVV